MPDNPVRLLLVEDNPGDADLVSDMLDDAAPGSFLIQRAGRLGEALELMRACGTDAVLLDLGLPDSAGLETFTTLHAACPGIAIVVLTGSGDSDTGIGAVRAGAQDYLVKGEITGSLLARALRYAMERKRVELALLASEERYQGLVDVALAASGGHSIEGLVYSGMISRHPQVLANLAVVRKVAGARVPVLIHGESGTGKELVARALHESGGRRNKPFIVINSAAIPETLLEAELFGIAKGTATGVSERAGKFELADGGTIFLDEIGDMDPVLQAKLLRFLQDGVIERVGGSKRTKVDVRVVAATNKNLAELQRQGKFRTDLFYRLNAVELTLPPLRGRAGDIREFIDYFITRCNKEFGKNIRGVSTPALELMLAHGWPGNIRQLEHVIERASLVADGDGIELKDLPDDFQAMPASAPTRADGRIGQTREVVRKRVADVMEKETINNCLASAGWNVAKAAELAGCSRVHLYRLMRKHGITRPQDQP